MPKKEPTPFEVDGVKCTVKDGLVNVALNPGWATSLRFPLKAKTDDLEVCRAKVRLHPKFAACKAQLIEVPKDTSGEPPPAKADDTADSGGSSAAPVPIFNGSSLRRELDLLRKDLDRRATQPLLFSPSLAPDYLVCTGDMPAALAREGFPFTYLHGVWAKRRELVNRQPAYTLAYSWEERGTPLFKLSSRNMPLNEGALVRLAMWFSPIASRFGHDAGEAIPGWLIGREDLIGQGHMNGIRPHFLVNSDTAPHPRLIRDTWWSYVLSPQSDGSKRHTRVALSFALLPAVPPDVCLFQLAIRYPGDAEAPEPSLELLDTFYEFPAGPVPSRLFEHRCSSHKRRKHPRKWCPREDTDELLVRCDEVTSACYWRRRSCIACGADGPIDGSPLENAQDVELELCNMGCGAFFCVQPLSSHCTQATASCCPHLEYTDVTPHVSNPNIAAERFVCSCDCCLTRMRKPHPCDVCERMPCACQGKSGWKALYGAFYDSVLAGESLR